MKEFNLKTFEKKLQKYALKKASEREQNYADVNESVSPWENYNENDYEDENDEEEYCEEESEKPQTVVDLLDKVSALVQTKAFKALFGNVTIDDIRKFINKGNEKSSIEATIMENTFRALQEKVIKLETRCENLESDLLELQAKIEAIEEEIIEDENDEEIVAVSAPEESESKIEEKNEVVEEISMKKDDPSVVVSDMKKETLKPSKEEKIDKLLEVCKLNKAEIIAERDEEFQRHNGIQMNDDPKPILEPKQNNEITETPVDVVKDLIDKYSLIATTFIEHKKLHESFPGNIKQDEFYTDIKEIIVETISKMIQPMTLENFKENEKFAAFMKMYMKISEHHNDEVQGAIDVMIICSKDAKFKNEFKQIWWTCSSAKVLANKYHYKKTNKVLYGKINELLDQIAF